ncbi:MAG: hypothetical protein A3K68_05915 [Euryarchaeota archaeon RBG_16_68_13]|nr:MAG: hypothetical protein A3K68_05915 [Euryarchaeota archaeon RBG_16_68_13]
MLTAVVDRTRGDGADRVRQVFEDVERRLARHRVRVERPVSVEIVRLPIMGATTSKPSGHTLYVSAGAPDSDMLDGLLAHEMGHMLLTESGHPSHAPRVIQRIWRSVRLPDRGREAFGQAYNHVQDIYADDLAFLADLQDRAYGFFANWIRGNAASNPGDRWKRAGLSASSGFALGNLARHGLLDEDDDLWIVARDADRKAGISTVDRYASFYAVLPKDPGADPFVSSMEELVRLLETSAGPRGKSRTF